MKIKKWPFFKFKVSNRTARMIIIVISCSYLLILVSPGFLNLFTHFNKSRKVLLPNFENFKVGETGGTCYIYIKGIDPINLTADIAFKLLLKTPSQISSATLKDAASKYILVDFTCSSYFRILDYLVSDSNTKILIPLSDFYDSHPEISKSLSEFYIESKTYDLTIPIMGRLSTYPIDRYFLYPSIEVRLENRKDGITAGKYIDIFNINVINNQRLENAGFELSRSYDRNKNELVIIKRNKITGLHVLWILSIGFILVIVFCYMILSRIKDPITSTPESIIAAAAVIFSLLSLRPSLVPSYINIITFVEVIIGLFVCIIVGVLSFRISLSLGYMKKILGNKNTDTSV